MSARRNTMIAALLAIAAFVLAGTASADEAVRWVSGLTG